MTFEKLAIGQRFTFNRMCYVKVSSVKAISLPSYSNTGQTRKFRSSARVWVDGPNDGEVKPKRKLADIRAKRHKLSVLQFG